MTEFVSPDWDAPIDVAKQVRRAPVLGSVRGMFIREILDAVQSAGARLPVAKRYVSFKKYPLPDYLQVIADGCALIHPDVSLRRAMRRVGRLTYPNFVKTVLGKTILAVAGNDFSSVVKLAPKAYRATIKPGDAKVKEKGERKVVVELRDIWNFPDSFQVGVWEGALAACKVEGEIKVRSRDLANADLEITWWSPEDGAPQGG